MQTRRMIIRKFFPQLVVSCILFTLTPNPGFSDTVILKSGEKLEGTIVAESDSAISLEIQVTASITDRKTINRDEIEEIVVTKEDEIAFTELKEVHVRDNSLEAQEYEAIVSRLNRFLTEFPESTFAEEVKSRLEAFKAEQERVVAGDIKINGNWISAEEAQKKASEIAGHRILMIMQEAMQSQDYVRVLNTFSQFNQPPAKGSLSYPDAVVIARQAADTLSALVEKQKPLQAASEEEFKNALALTRSEKRPALQAQYDSEQDRYKSLLEEAKARREIPPYLPRSKRGLADISTALTAMNRVLNNVKLDDISKSVELTRQAQQEVSNENYESAQELAKEANRLWGDNVQAKNLNASLPDLVKAAQAAAEAEAQAAAEAAEKAAAEAAAKAAAEKKAADADKKATSKDKKTASTNAQEKPFYKTPMGAAGIVIAIIVIVGIVSAVNKARASKADSLDE